MHTHLDHSSLCLISSLLSPSSSLSMLDASASAVLLSTRHSNHDPLLTLTRSRMTTGGAGGGGGEVQGPGQQPAAGESLIVRPTNRKEPLC